MAPFPWIEIALVLLILGGLQQCIGDRGGPMREGQPAHEFSVEAG